MEYPSTTSKSRSPVAWLTSFWEHGDRLFKVVILFSALSIVFLVLAIFYELWQNSALTRHTFGWSFLTTTRWDPAIDNIFGAFPFILGTLITSLLAMLIAVPVGLGVAIFLAELSPNWLRQPVGLLVELLAAVPSVVYGLWGLFVFIPTVVRPLSQGLNSSLGFIPLFAGPVFGPSRLAAGLILSIMVLPTISAVSRDVFRAIPTPNAKQPSLSGRQNGR